MLRNEEIEMASDEMESIPFYPTTTGGKLAVMKVLRSMVSTKQQLNWLTFTMVNKAGRWKGCGELRGVFCSRFKPADGIEADCAETAGFTPGELEARTISDHEDRKALSGARDQKLLAGATAAIPGIEEQFVAAMASNRPVRTNSVARRAAPEDVKRTEDLLRQLMRDGA
jgi:hypothetical protein